MEGAKDSESWASPCSLSAGLGRSGASFSLTSLVSLWGGYSTNRPRRSLGCRSLWLRVSPFFSLCFLRSLTVALFFWEILKSPRHPSTLSLPRPFPSLTPPQCSALQSVSSTLHPGPPNGAWDGDGGDVGGQERKNRKKLLLGFVFNCSVAAISCPYHC